MSWTGSIDRNWVNENTDEYIEFRKRRDKFHIWLIGQVDDRRRGKKLGECEKETKAKQIALAKIEAIGEERYFSRHE